MPSSSAAHPSGPAGHGAGHPHPPTGVVVLAGGASRRWHGTDKTAAQLAGRPVLVHLVDGLRAGFGADVPVVVVGPPDHPAAAGLTGVRWTREDPPGGGPVAGLAAGLAALPGPVDVVAVVAGDVPFGGPAVARLVGALVGTSRDGATPDGATPDGVDVTAGGTSGGAVDDVVDGVVGEDPQGRRQPLLAAYRTVPLAAALAAAPVADRSVKDLLAGLRVLAVPVGTVEAFDLDTPDDLAAAAAMLEQPRP